MKNLIQQVRFEFKNSNVLFEVARFTVLIFVLWAFAYVICTAITTPGAFSQLQNL